MDFTTLIGIVFGLGAVFGGQILDGGHPGSVVQFTAALIVFGGTFGAVIAQFPRVELGRAMRQMVRVLSEESRSLAPIADQLVELARKSRRDGLLVLEGEASKSNDTFFRQAIATLVDGYEASELRTILEQIMDQDVIRQQPGPRFFEAAGGYAPTIGILGAVIGLIHVMQNLAEPDKIGSGIAVAFVATIYGVGSANLIFLPLAGKMKMKMAAEMQRKELITEGVCAIQEGVNPQMLGRRLAGFVQPPAPAKSKGTRGRKNRRG